MAANADYWFVRLPDGRTLRSRSTESLRQHLRAGRIPRESRVRRTPDEPWQTLDRVAEFADLANGESDASEESRQGAASPSNKPRVSGAELRTLGVRGLAEELFNAFDSSLQKSKLVTAALAGLALGLTLVLRGAALHLIPPEWYAAIEVATALTLCVLFSACTSILTSMTALELSRYRPARFNEVRGEIAGSTLRLTCAFSLLGGFIVGVIVLLRSLPGWLAPAGPGDANLWLDSLLNIVQSARLLLEVICWPILGFAMLLLGPILIVEDYSIWQGLREWLGMLRQHLGRIYLYQALAFAFAAVLTLPLLAPVALAFSGTRIHVLDMPLSEAMPFFLLVGLALTPMLSYLLVAHVFIYLNLRYEFYSTRER